MNLQESGHPTFDVAIPSGDRLPPPRATIDPLSVGPRVELPRELLPITRPDHGVQVLTIAFTGCPRWIGRALAPVEQNDVAALEPIAELREPAMQPLPWEMRGRADRHEEEDAIVRHQRNHLGSE